MKLSIASAGMVLAIVVGMLSACEHHIPEMSLDDVRHLAEQPGAGEVEFFIEELDPASQLEFLAWMGRPDDNPADYVGIPLTHGYSESHDHRGRSSICGHSVRTIGHSSACLRARYRSSKTTYLQQGRCAHRGYTMRSRATRKTTVCRSKRCLYRSVREVYYHQRQ